MHQSKNIIKRYGLSRCPAPAVGSSLLAKDSALNVQFLASARLAACCRKLYTLLDSGHVHVEEAAHTLGIRHRQRNMTWLKATTPFRRSSTNSKGPKALFDYLSAPLKSCFEYSPFSINSDKKCSAYTVGHSQESPKYRQEFICSESSELSADITKQETEVTSQNVVSQPTDQLQQKELDVIVNIIDSQPKDFRLSEDANLPTSNDQVKSELQLSEQWTDMESKEQDLESDTQQVTNSAEQQSATADDSDLLNQNASSRANYRVQNLRVTATSTCSTPKNLYKI